MDLGTFMGLERLFDRSVDEGRYKGLGGSAEQVYGLLDVGNYNDTTCFN